MFCLNKNPVCGHFAVGLAALADEVRQRRLHRQRAFHRRPSAVVVGGQDGGIRGGDGAEADFDAQRPFHASKVKSDAKCTLETLTDRAA